MVIKFFATMFSNVNVFGESAITGQVYLRYLRAMGNIVSADSDENTTYIDVTFDNGAVWVNKEGDEYMVAVKDNGIIILTDRISDANIEKVVAALMANNDGSKRYGDTIIITNSKALGLRDELKDKYDDVCQEYFWKEYEKYTGNDVFEKQLFNLLNRRDVEKAICQVCGLIKSLIQ